MLPLQVHGAAPWAYDNMCEYIEILRSRGRRTSLHILNTGSGPFAPREIECEVSFHPGWWPSVPLSSPLKAHADDLAKELCIGGITEGYLQVPTAT